VPSRTGLRRGKKFGSGSVFNNAPAIKKYDSLRKALGLREVVRREYQGRTRCVNRFNDSFHLASGRG
jgi:hypothetical protein